jgi:hypothetical protein
MAESESYRDTGETLRVLFCLGIAQNFFDAEPDTQKQLIQDIPAAFADLGGRFGIKVLGTMDDDELMVGPSEGWPWTAYILADAPNLAAVTGVCNLVRESEAAGRRLWSYMRIEARVGRALFFGNE